MDKAALIQKMERYCAYQERCHHDVQSKLKKLGASWGTAQEVILHLMEENFLNEQRFANAFAEGKLRINHWGKIKIKNALIQKFVSKNCIQIALNNLDEEEYITTFYKRVEVAKLRFENERENYVRLQKIKRYLYARGFETDLIGRID